ncbi:PRC-barrel domain-containing protein [uncultured Marivita sp.]|uniref:PRC-barrel domain-containing protein n=1 Tax=uncultured Marivita sp. TaxID=888080 RepID=UPI00261CA5F7|nr:PRC-barrel domain-containing protein [uncultured Marivita sp.]
MTYLTTRTATLAAMLCAGAAYGQDAETGSAGTVETRDDTYLQSVEDVDVRTADGEKIGEVEEILIDAEGNPAGFLLEIGGFLDLGDSDVSVPLEALTWSGSHYVSKMTVEQLERLQPFDE